MQTEQNIAIHCKISFGSQIRRAPLSTLSYAALEALVRSLFSLPNETLSIKYKDEEEDLITLTTDNELETAISSLPPNRVFHLTVTLVSSDSPSSVDRPHFQRHAIRNHHKQMKHEAKKGKHHLKQECKQAKKKQKTLEKEEFVRQYNSTFSPESVTISSAPNTQQSVAFTITNTGTVDWPSGTSLIRVGKGKNSDEKIALSAPVTPGESYPLTMNVPVSDTGNHFSHWRVMLPNGVKLGAKFLIKTENFSFKAHRNPQMKKRCSRGALQLRERGSKGSKMWRLMHQYDGDVGVVSGLV